MDKQLFLLACLFFMIGLAVGFNYTEIDQEDSYEVITKTGNNVSLASMRSGYDNANMINEYVDDSGLTHIESFTRIDGVWHRDAEIITRTVN